MNLASIEKELLHLQALVARWIEQKYAPDIERDIALERLRNIYAEFLSINNQKFDQTQIKVAPPLETPPNEHQAEENIDVDQAIDNEQEIVENNQFENICVDEHIDDIAQVIDGMVASTSQPLTDEPSIVPPDENSQRDGESKEIYAEGTQVDLPVEDEARRQRFIHDLFCNDETFYIGEMRKIEVLSSFDDVLIYIGQKYAWTPNNATAEEFVGWIAARFID